MCPLSSAPCSVSARNRCAPLRRSAFQKPGSSCSPVLDTTRLWFALSTNKRCAYLSSTPSTAACLFWASAWGCKSSMSPAKRRRNCAASIFCREKCRPSPIAEFFEDCGMRLAHRIIPCLDTDGERVVKGVNFVRLRDAGDPVALAARYNAEGADELIVLDIAASRDRRPTFLETIRRVAAQLAIPLTAGGGIRTLEDGRAVVRAGADKVTVNTAAV